MDTRGGRYFRGSGIHWPAVTAQLVGTAAAFLWPNAYSRGVSVHPGL